jgi:hypothetical protein
MKLDVVIEDVGRSARQVVAELVVLTESYADEPDVFFTGRTLLDRMNGLIERFDRAVAGSEVPGEPTPVPAAPALGGSPAMLAQLRRLATAVRGNEVDWTVLHQAGMAARDQGLTDLATIGIDESRRISKWLNTRVKEASPQIVMMA